MSEIADILVFVGATPPFDRLDEATLRALCRSCQVAYHREGVEIVPAGTDAAELGLIRSGVIGIYDTDGALRDKRAEGDTFGYPALLTGEPPQFGVRSIEDALVYHFPDTAFRAACAASPEFDQFFSAALVRRVRDGLLGSEDSDYGRARLASIMSSPPISVSGDCSIREAARHMAEANISSLFVEHDDRIGILTDRDLRRRVIAANLDPARPCAEVATFDLLTATTDDTVIDAMLMMAERALHHLPIMDDGRLVGLVSASDVFRARSSQPVFLTREVRRAGSAERVAEVCQRRDQLFGHLVTQGARALHIGRFMTGITDAATVRLVELAIEELGAPPCRFAWIAFGSQARGEQSLRTDQDNGLILSAAPTELEAKYFAKLAERVCEGLHAAGFVRCPGNVMASNPQWRRSLAQWQTQFERWVDEPDPHALMEASIFFDCRGVFGDLKLVDELRESIAERTRDNSLFLRCMAQNALTFSPPLGLFRRFLVESDGSDAEGLNLKSRGAIPVVGLARVRALELGLLRPATQARLVAIGEALPGDREDLASLGEAFELIEQLRMRHQASQVNAGEEPTNLVALESLSALRREHLRSAFEVVRTAQRVLRVRYQL